MIGAWDTHEINRPPINQKVVNRIVHNETGDYRAYDQCQDYLQNKLQIEIMFAKFALKNQRNFTTDDTYLRMFLFSKHFLKLISECLLVSYSPSMALKKDIFA